MRAPLRWVLWDVKDTLLRVRTSVGEQYCQEAERMGLELSPVEVQAAFHQAYRHYSSTYPNYGISRGMNGRSWWISLVQDTFSRCRVQDPLLIDTMAQNLYHNFCSADTWEVGYRQHWTPKDSHNLTPFLPVFGFLSGISRCTEGSGEMFLIRTKSWSGVKLRHSP